MARLSRTEIQRRYRAKKRAQAEQRAALLERAAALRQRIAELDAERARQQEREDIRAALAQLFPEDPAELERDADAYLATFFAALAEETEGPNFPPGWVEDAAAHAVDLVNRHIVPQLNRGNAAQWPKSVLDDTREGRSIAIDGTAATLIAVTATGMGRALRQFIETARGTGFPSFQLRIDTVVTQRDAVDEAIGGAEVFAVINDRDLFNFARPSGEERPAPRYQVQASELGTGDRKRGAFGIDFALKIAIEGGGVGSGGGAWAAIMRLEGIAAPEPGRPLGTQRNGAGNCVVAAVRSALLDGGQREVSTRRRGEVLRVCSQWEARTAADGFDVAKDLAEFAKDLGGVRIVYRTVDGAAVAEGVTAEEAKRKKWRTVELWGSNGHCWGIDLPEFPRNRAARTLERFDREALDEFAAAEAEARAAIAKARRVEPKAVPYADVAAKAEPKSLGIMVRFASRYFKDKPARLFPRAGCLIADDGRVFRRPEHRDADGISALERMRMHLEGGNPFEAPANLAAMYLSPSAMYFEAFQRLNQFSNIAKTAPDSVASWRAAQFETLAAPYRSPDAATWKGATVSIDIAKSYPSVCEPDATHAAPRAAPYVARWGYPGGGCLVRFDCRGCCVAEVCGMLGAVRLASWAISANCVPAIAVLVSRHLAASSWLPTPLLAYLVERGDLTAAEPVELWACPDRVASGNALRFPRGNAATDSEKAINALAPEMRRSLGKLAEKQRETILVTDQFEARTLVENGRGSVRKEIEADGVAVLSLDREQSAPRYFHVRACVLAYSAINLFESIREIDPAGLLYVMTDSATVKAGTDLSRVDIGTRWGQWREKPAGRWQGEASETPQRTGVATGVNVPEGVQSLRETLDGLAAYKIDPSRYQGAPLIYARGQGGSGKTTAAVRALCSLYGPSNVGIAVPTHAVRVAHADDFGAQFPGVRVGTWQKWIGMTFKAENWTPERLELVALPRALVWDEIHNVGGDWPALGAYLRALVAAGVLVVCCGDPGQLEPVAADKGTTLRVVEGLTTWPGGRVLDHEEDHRAICPELRALKRRMWQKSDRTQYSEAAAALPLQSWATLLEEWHPRDIVLAATHAVKDAAALSLQRLHMAKFPEVPARIVVAVDRGAAADEAAALAAEEPSKKRSGHRGGKIAVPGTDRTASDYVGTREFINVADAVNLPQPWRYEATATIHGYQGQTVGGQNEKESPRVWLLDERQDASGFVNQWFTSISRVRWMSQLRRVLPPAGAVADATAEWIGSGLRVAADVYELKKRLKFVADADKRKGRDGQTMKLEELAELCASSDKLCPCCGGAILWACTDPKNQQRWSIDRIKDDLGHSRANCRITHVGCNSLHKR